MKTNWRSGNRVELLENGEAFFPRVFEAIESATREVLLETFIIDDDEVGRKLQRAAITAAKRGVRVVVTADAWGSRNLPQAFIDELTGAGVTFRWFHLVPAWRMRIAWFRRLHRKLITIDGERGFVGGINFESRHVTDDTAESMQDYAVEVRGPVVADIHAVMTRPPRQRRWLPWLRRRGRAVPPQLEHAGDTVAALVARDNARARTAIEWHYRKALASARSRAIVANAYFFPGYRLLRELRRAARRGVDVRLVLQGAPDEPLMQAGSRLLYDQLMREGIRIFEYCNRAFHGKVAVVDDEWATVGSSNLEPLSLSFNLEANLLVRDRAFTADLAGRLERLMDDDCTEVLPDDERAGSRVWWRPAASATIYHLLRHVPELNRWLPTEDPSITAATAPGDLSSADRRQGPA